MSTEKTQTTFHRSISSDKELEQAIETLQHFTLLNEAKSVPSLEHFQLQNGSLTIRKLSTLQKTLACLIGAVSDDSRLEQKEEIKAIKGRVLRSVDIIKIAIMRMHCGSVIEEKIKDSLLRVVHDYNAMVSQAKQAPKSLSDKLKYFFLKAAGWHLDDEVQQNEIHLPETPFYDSTESGMKSGHKFTFRTVEARSQKISLVLHAAAKENSHHLPQEQEIDLFRMKAFTLLSKQEVLPVTFFPDALDILRKSPIEITLSESPHETQVSSVSIISLRQTICPFPGEEIELKGAFSRSSSLSIPIKDSFRVSAKAFQTGFPDPLQFIGIAFSEKLLPHSLVRAYLVPDIDYLLKKRGEIARELLPKGSLNEKAKLLLQMRKRVFKNHKEILLPQIKRFIQLLLQEESEAEHIHDFFVLIGKKANFFEELSFIHARIFKRFIDRLFVHFPQKAQENTPNCESIIALCTSHLIAELEKITLELQKTNSSDEKLSLVYSQVFGNFFIKHIPQIVALLLSEQFHFLPPTLTAIQQKLLASSFGQLAAFISELEQTNLTEETAEDQLFTSISSLIKNEIALFSSDSPQNSSLQIVHDLEKYYLERFQANQI